MLVDWAEPSAKTPAVKKTLTINQTIASRDTSVAVRIIQRCVVVTCDVQRDSVDSWLVPSAVRAREADRVVDAAIGEPTRGTAMQAGPPGQIKLPHGGQLAPQGHTAV